MLRLPKQERIHSPGIFKLLWALIVCFTAQQSSANISLCCFILSKGPSWTQPACSKNHATRIFSTRTSAVHYGTGNVCWGHDSSLPSRFFLANKSQTGLKKSGSILQSITILSYFPFHSFISILCLHVSSINVRIKLLQIIVLTLNLFAVKTKQFSTIIPSSYSKWSGYVPPRFPIHDGFHRTNSHRSQTFRDYDARSQKFQTNQCDNWNLGLVLSNELV